MKSKLLVLTLAAVISLLVGGIFNSQVALAVDNFTITNFDVEMELGKDEDGRSTLRTVETITADFQRRNENQGLERSLIKNYDGHPTSFKLESVTDENGAKLSHHWVGSTLRIGDKGTYVYGPHTYKITYTQRDVTKHFDNTSKDEFYWNVIGTEWRVPIDQATVEIVVAPELRAATQTDARCYLGARLSTTTCEVREDDGSYVLTARGIGDRRGMTVALGFAPETFAEYEQSLGQRLLIGWLALTVITTIAGIVVIIWLSVRLQKQKYRDAELGTIVPEYLPPKTASVATSAAVSPKHHATMAAELTDLAVRRYIQILETRPKSFLKAAEYDIKVVKDISNLRDEEREILKDMFNRNPKVGDRLALKKLQNNASVYTRFSDNDTKLRGLLRGKYDLKHIDKSKRAWFVRVSKILLFLAVITLSPMLLISALVAYVMGRTLWVLSDKGLELRRYIEGLDMYIKVAEEDRLKMLQSPEGAEKIDIADPTNPAQLVKLYEKVLPYAVLLGREKEWTKRLGEYYKDANTSPGWYSGNTAFNAVMFSSMMSNFSSSASAASTSSSSGGSGGGGFSGGGGGGGGGGGW